MKKKTPDPNAARHQWIRCRVNESEAAIVATWLAGIDAESVGPIAEQIAARLALRAPFANPAELLRAVFDLPPIRPGAPIGNQNRYGPTRSD